jgi:mono/diheme cytochrome c family protein
MVKIGLSWARGLRGIGVAAMLVGLGVAQTARADDADLVKRGEYLARAGDCVACHTAPGGQALAGGLKMDTPFGPIYTPNITPDRATGIGAWTDDEFYRALHEGIRKDGAYLYPVFPFPWFTHVSRDDVLAIKAYLFAQKPVHAPDKPPGFAFPFNIRTTLLTWRTLFFKEGKAGESAPKQGDLYERGRYLVEGLGHCGECHNHHNVLGASDWSGKFEGGAIDGWYAPNITADGRQGIGAWSEDAIAKFLKTGVGPHSNVALGPMQEVIHDSLSYLTDDDRRAIADYLKTIKPKEKFANSQGGYARPGAPGQALYQSHCASCHGLKGEGLPGHVPALAHNGAVMAQGPQNVIRVALGGLTPKQGLAPMPAVGADLTDAEVANIADYVRNSFGNAAPAATKPSEVATLRAKVRTPMLAIDRADCESPNTSQIKELAADGAIAKLAEGNPVNLLPALDAVLAKLTPADPKQADAFVADLAGAYCQALFAGAAVAEPARADRLGRFATLAYSRMQTRLAQANEPEAVKPQ